MILLCLTADDFTLSNARRFYSSKGDPLGLKGLSFNRSKVGVLAVPSRVLTRKDKAGGV